MRIAGLVGLIGIMLTVALQAGASQQGPNVPHLPQRDRSVPGKPVPVRPAAPDRVLAAARRATPAPRWPAAGTARFALANGTRSVAARAGGLAVQVAAPQSRGTAPGEVEVEVLSRPAAAKSGIDGVLLRLDRTDAVRRTGRVALTVDASTLRGAYGGDWASRLRLWDVGQREPLPSRNEGGRVSAEVEVAAQGTTFALAAAPEGSTGDYKATTLSPSGSWSVSTQSGSFAWSYGLKTPPVPGGLEPELALSYSSSAVDGQTASTNNQTSWIGQGWSLWPGFIERSYKSCADDTAPGSPKTGDLCWETNNATMSFGGESSELVYDAGTWRPEKDDGTRIEHLTGAANGDDNGEYWRVTTTDGTQYYFGRNRLPEWSAGKPETGSAWTVPVFGNDAGEPCHGATFEASDCRQAYRWNLDHVVDAKGNSLAYYYAPEANGYGLNLAKEKATYTRGGTLLRAEYGMRAGEEYAGDAPARVVFETSDRCLSGAGCSTHTGTTWPDVPWDQDCGGATCPGKYSPTFWSTKRLTTVTTQVRGSAGYRSVDAWSLEHVYPSPGDGTSPALWLHGITHTGLVGGSESVPAVTFDGVALANRVNSATDGLPPLFKYRVGAINNESGGLVNVSYAPPNCSRDALPAADTNSLRCFPVRWVMPPATEPANDWFHKYVVAQVAEVDRVGGGMTQVTNYDYHGGAAWHYKDDPLIPPDRRTWSEYRGYERVVVRKGDPAREPGKPESRTEYRYFRGMHGDRLAAGGAKNVEVKDSRGTAIADAEPLAGFLRESVTYDGDALVSGAIHDPWQRGPTATQGSLRAYQVESVRTVTRTALSSGGFRTTQVDTQYDHEGNPTQVDDLGDLSTGDDDRCTRTTYARNTSTWLLALPRRAHTVAVSCGATASYPEDAISDVRTFYDGGGPDDPPSAGNPTRVEEVKDYDGGTPVYLTTARTTYDRYGRALEVRDALDRKTTTSYEETAGLTTSSTVINAVNHATKTTLEPAWGLPLEVVDANDRRSDLTYDPLGRLTAVWKPGRSKAAGLGPHVRYAYGVRRDGPSWVKTQTLGPNSNYVTGYELLDGFLRKRQSQSPSPRGGRVLADTLYNSRGLAYTTRAPYYNADAAPGTVLFEPQDNQVPGATLTSFDGAERPVVSAFRKLDVEQWRTTTAYGGDRVSVTPPRGGTATTTISDARGRTTELRQYHGAAASGAYDATTYAYTRRGDLKTVRDAAGNTWRYEYDLRGRKIRADDPDKGVTTMRYDDAGQLLATTDARGSTIATVYDEAGRRIETRRDSATGPLLTRWTYDTLSKGEPTSATRFAGGNEYTRAITGYDDGGRPTGETITIPAAEGGIAGTYTTNTTYRPDGSPASVALPALGRLARETLVHTYDELGLPDTLEGSTKYVTDVEYTALGEPSQLELGSVGKRVWQTSYYEEGTRRLAEVLTEREVGTLMVDDLRYRYDPAGNVLSITDAATGFETDRQCFAYDHLRRTTEAWTAGGECADAPSPTALGGPAPYWASYDYDPAGNRTQETRHGLDGAASTVRDYEYPEPGEARPHAVRSVQTSGPGAGTASFDYDAAGNMTARPGPVGEQTLEWNPEGALEKVSTGSDATSYVYDADGAVLIRRDPGSVTLFVGGGELRVDTATGTKHGTRYYGPAARTAAGLSWLVADHHGTSSVAIQASTLAATRRRFDPFGAVREAASPWPGGSRSFVGGTSNAATGLIRLGAREYDPALGRFVSVDPIIDPSDPQQMNAYAYANNNPVTMTDPDGLKTWTGEDGRWVNGGGTPAAPARPAPPRPPSPPVRSTAHRQDPGGRCPRGQEAYCRAMAQRAATNRRAIRKELDMMDEPDPNWYFSEKTGKIPVRHACTADRWGQTLYDCTPAQIERARELNDRAYADWKERSRRQGDVIRKGAVLAGGFAATHGGPAAAVPGGTIVIALGGSMSVCGSVSVLVGVPMAGGAEGCVAVDSHGVGVSGGRKVSTSAPEIGVDASISVKASTGDVESLGGRELAVSGGVTEFAISSDGNMSVGRTLGPKAGGGASASYGNADSGYLFRWSDVLRVRDVFGLW